MLDTPITCIKTPLKVTFDARSQSIHIRDIPVRYRPRILYNDYGRPYLYHVSERFYQPDSTPARRGGACLLADGGPLVLS